MCHERELDARLKTHLVTFLFERRHAVNGDVLLTFIFRRKCQRQFIVHKFLRWNDAARNQPLSIFTQRPAPNGNIFTRLIIT